MNLVNMGREQLENGGLDSMLKQVGINDIGSFVSQFRSKATQEGAAATGASSGGQPDLMSMGSSFLNQMGGSSGKKQSGGGGDLIGGAMSAYKMFSGNKGSSGGAAQGASSGGGSGDLISGAMNAYKMFSGGKGTSGSSGGSSGSGGGGLFDSISGAVGNAQQIQGLLKSLDKNGDGKINIDDIQLILQGLGLGSVSPYISKALFKAVDRNGNGELDLTDVMALAAIVSKLQGRFGSGAQPVPQN
ncbi:unnamed protein product [Adineta steineri]|uniref:EF-hand domain-containing protein n=1 Tax=Adineta steineri TaxID=433720 RepID=A0A813M9K0_9BILA|nr:unnamed protein product [Adineta steineri]CAF0744024.1 unnamed protein product [Adineta steineri]CAF3883922.1 unnamed protein product [Adineta steineri]CAF3916996.1 unnamed protein product [Adineta steineri]